MKNPKNVILSVAALAFALSLGACGKSEKGVGPAEKAGATMGKAIDQATEKAGEALKDAGDKAKEVAKDAVDKMKDTKK